MFDMGSRKISSEALQVWWELIRWTFFNCNAPNDSRGETRPYVIALSVRAYKPAENYLDGFMTGLVQLGRESTKESFDAQVAFFYDRFDGAMELALSVEFQAGFDREWARFRYDVFDGRPSLTKKEALDLREAGYVVLNTGNGYHFFGKRLLRNLLHQVPDHRFLWPSSVESWQTPHGWSYDSKWSCGHLRITHVTKPLIKLLVP